MYAPSAPLAHHAEAVRPRKPRLQLAGGHFPEKTRKLKISLYSRCVADYQPGGLKVAANSFSTLYNHPPACRYSYHLQGVAGGFVPPCRLAAGVRVEVCARVVLSRTWPCVVVRDRRHSR